MGSKSGGDSSSETSPKFNTGLGFALRLNGIMDNLTEARINKDGSIWVDYLIAAYIEGRPDFTDDEIKSLDRHMNNAMRESNKMTGSPMQAKKLKMTPKLFEVCWRFECKLRKLLREHGLLNIDEVRYEKDSY